MLNSDVKAKWIAALRSGEYKQAKGRLKTDEGHCCLGVLCEVYKAEHPGFEITKHEVVLPLKVSQWAGLTSRTYNVQGMTLRNVVSLNDREGFSFNEIADIIENEPMLVD